MKKRILIIDDNEQDKKIMKRFLNKAGFQDISFAVTGEEGLDKADSEKPALVILDTILPGIDGFETCRRLRESKKLSGLRIIIITGSIDAVDAVKARKVGADDYCAKTSDFAPLLEAVAGLT